MELLKCGMKVKQHNSGRRNIWKIGDWGEGGLVPKTVKPKNGEHKNVLKIPRS